MADGADKTSGSKAGSDRSRPPVTKVKVPGSGAAEGSADAPPGSDAAGTTKAAGRGGKPPSGGRARRPPAPPKPWWKRGGVWFVIIAAEAALAFLLSTVARVDPADVALDGIDTGRFCTEVAAARQAAASAPTDPAADVVEALDGLVTAHESQAAAFRRMIDPGPEAVRADLDRLARVQDELAATARTLAARPRTGPSADALGEMAAADGRQAAQQQRPLERVRTAVMKACGVDISAAATPSTSAAPVTTASGTGSAPTASSASPVPAPPTTEAPTPPAAPPPG